MRTPSIHITEDELANILVKLELVNERISLLTAKDILLAAKNKQLTSRAVSINNARMERKIATLVKSSKSDVELLSTLIYNIRKSQKHRGIKRITNGTPDYLKLKDLALATVAFCNEFNLPKRDGFIKYIKLGLSRISSYRNYIGKLINMQEGISQLYEDELIIINDANHIETESIFKLYMGIISTKTGLTPDIKKDPTKYKYFVKVREITDELDVPANIYIEAQFWGLEWTDGYPEPNQLVGDNALLRLNKYMYKKKIKISNNSDTSKNNLADILRRIGNDNN